VAQFNTTTARRRRVRASRTQRQVEPNGSDSGPTAASRSPRQRTPRRLFEHEEEKEEARDDEEEKEGGETTRRMGEMTNRRRDDTTTRRGEKRDTPDHTHRTEQHDKYSVPTTTIEQSCRRLCSSLFIFFQKLSFMYLCTTPREKYISCLNDYGRSP
jgi:hypothetical protein